MAREIERKFLVRHELWRADPAQGVRYRQGYLSADPGRVVRVRVAGDHAYLTIKGLTTGIRRAEFEYPIPVADAEPMLDAICIQPVIEKTRYRVSFAGHEWEVDVFFGANEGLIVAELELPSESTPFDRPPWLGVEVSDDPRYFNSNLVAEPYSRWGK